MADVGEDKYRNCLKTVSVKHHHFVIMSASSLPRAISPLVDESVLGRPKNLRYLPQAHNPDDGYSFRPLTAGKMAVISTNDLIDHTLTLQFIIRRCEEEIEFLDEDLATAKALVPIPSASTEANEKKKVAVKGLTNDQVDALTKEQVLELLLDTQIALDDRDKVIEDQTVKIVTHTQTIADLKADLKDGGVDTPSEVHRLRAALVLKEKELAHKEKESEENMSLIRGLRESRELVHRGDQGDQAVEDEDEEGKSVLCKNNTKKPTAGCFCRPCKKKRAQYNLGRGKKGGGKRKADAPAKGKKKTKGAKTTDDGPVNCPEQLTASLSKRQQMARAGGYSYRGPTVAE